MDVGCYCVSGARLLAGEPRRVSAVQVTNDEGVDVRLAGVLEHDGGVLTTFDCALDLPNRAALEAVGSAGTLRAASPWHCRDTVLELERDGEVERLDLEPADSYRLQLENFAAAVRGDAAPLLGRADAVGQARAIEALYASADAGGTPVAP